MDENQLRPLETQRRSVPSGDVRSQTPCTRGNISLGNREIPRPPARRWEASRAERIVKPKGVRR